MNFYKIISSWILILWVKPANRKRQSFSSHYIKRIFKCLLNEHAFFPELLQYECLLFRYSPYVVLEMDWKSLSIQYNKSIFVQILQSLTQCKISNMHLYFLCILMILITLLLFHWNYKHMLIYSLFNQCRCFININSTILTLRQTPNTKPNSSP